MKSLIPDIEQDIESDARLWLSEEVDLDNNFINTAICASSQKNPIKKEVEVLIQEHFEKLRFAQFAARSLESEIIRNSRFYNQKCPADITDDIQSNDTADSNDSFTIDFPFTIHLSKIVSRNAPENTSKEALLRQLKKDLERDRFLINNSRIIGAAVGMSGIVESLSCVYDQLMEEESLPFLSTRQKEDLSQEILIKSSRTHSGALAYHALNGLIDTDASMLLPNSSVTPPIKISISLDSVKGTSSFRNGMWGIVAKITSEFIYSIKPKDEISLNDDTRDRNNKRGEDHRTGFLFTHRPIHILYEDFVSYPVYLSQEHYYSSRDIISDSKSGFICLTLEK